MILTYPKTPVLQENNPPEYQFFSRVATSVSQRATREKNWYEGGLFSYNTGVLGYVSIIKILTL